MFILIFFSRIVIIVTWPKPHVRAPLLDQQLTQQQQNNN